MVHLLLRMTCKSYIFAYTVSLLLTVSAQTITVNPTAPIGAPLVFELQTGVPMAPYLLDLSATGTTPGLPIHGTTHVIPLNPPLVFSELFGFGSPATFVGFQGVTDQFGLATAILNIPPTINLIGIGLHTSFATLDPTTPGQIGTVAPAVHFDIVAGSTGWTELTPSSDSRRIYVSDSLGNDSNSGLGETEPVRSLVRGVSLLRSGFPDWLHLRRGDVWTNQALGNWNKSGRSATEPMVITTYGASLARPLIRTPSSAHGLTTAQNPINHLAFMGFHLVPHSRTATSQRAGVQILGPASDILFEDVCVEGYKDNFVIQVFSGPISNFRLRRSHVLDAYCSAAHSQGAFFKGVDGVLLEENIFDHNGWKEGPEGAPATVFNHNVYMQSDCRNLQARGNIFARGASSGIMGRCGGVVENNLFVRNPVSLTLGYTVGATPTPGGVTGTAIGNVILEGNDISPSNPRALGIVIGNINPSGVTIANNIIAHEASAGTSGRGIIADGSNGVGVQRCSISRNTIHDWCGSLIDLRGQAGTSLVIDAVTQNVVLGGPETNFLVHVPTTSLGTSFSGNTYHSTAGWFRTGSATYSYSQWVATAGEQNSSSQLPQFTDPGRSVASYSGGIGGPPSLDGFLTRAKQQSRSDWNPSYTAEAVIQYIRAGFDL